MFEPYGDKDDVGYNNDESGYDGCDGGYVNVYYCTANWNYDYRVLCRCTTI